MNQTGESSPPTPREIREPKSTLYVFVSATTAAVILGFTIFMLVRGFQWRAALADLRTEPGIEILSVERLGFFKKRLLGLRDPLAPPAESILRKNNIGPHTAEVILTEYHSLNTPYALDREKAEQARFDDLRQSVLAAVGQFAATTTAKREADLERITQMLFQARFPEPMKTVALEWREGNWYARGELYAPAREAFVRESPAYIVEGELKFDHLVNLTESRTSAIRADLDATDLFTVDLDGGYVHIDRMRRLAADYDIVCRESGLPKPRFQLEILTADLAGVVHQIAAVKKGLTSPGGIPADRFLPDLAKELPAGEKAKAFLRLVPVPAP
jgi:hypothetical protein